MKNSLKLMGFVIGWALLMSMVADYGMLATEPKPGAIEHIQRLEDGERTITTVQCTQAEITIYYYRPKRYEHGPLIHVEAVDSEGNVLDFPLEAYRQVLPDSLFRPSRKRHEKL